ncbi:uncharacterized protein LOC144545791 [Carex rostrata]
MGLLRGVLHQRSVSIDALRNAECYIVEMDPNRCILRSQLEQLSSATQTQLCFVAVIGILCRHLKIILDFNLNRFNGPIHFSLHLNFFINWSNIKIFMWCIRQLDNEVLHCSLEEF